MLATQTQLLTFAGSTDAGSVLTRLPTVLVAALPEAVAMEAVVVDTVEATEDSKEEVSYFNHVCPSSLLTNSPGGYGGGGGRGKHLLPITISVKI